MPNVAHDQRTFDPIVGNYLARPLCACGIVPCAYVRAVAACRRIVRLPARATTSRGQEETGLTQRSMKLVNCVTTVCGCVSFAKRVLSRQFPGKTIPFVGKCEKWERLKKHFVGGSNPGHKAGDKEKGAEVGAPTPTSKSVSHLSAVGTALQPRKGFSVAWTISHR